MDIKKDISSLTFGDVVGNLFTFGLWFYLATIINPSSYGEIFYILGISAIPAYFALFAHPYTITVLTAQKIKIQSTLYLISLICVTIIGIPLALFFERFEILLLIFGIVISSLGTAELLGKKSFSTYTKFFLAQKILICSLGLSFYYLFGEIGVLYGIGLANLVYLPVVIQTFLKIKINFGLLNSNLRFILENYGLGLTGVLKNEIDKVIIPSIIGLSILGQYSLALQILNGLIIVPGIIFKYILPHDATGNPNKKLKKLSIIFSIIIAIFASASSSYVIKQFFPNFLDSIDAFQIMSFSIIPLMLTAIFTSELLGIKKSNFVLFSRLLVFVLIIIFMIFLGPIFGITGLALSFLIANSLETIFLAICRKKTLLEKKNDN